MEAGGFVSALARHPKAKLGRSIVSIVVRGISDDARFKDNDGGVRAAACRNATIVASELAADILEDPNHRLLSLLPRAG